MKKINHIHGLFYIRFSPLRNLLRNAIVLFLFSFLSQSVSGQYTRTDSVHINSTSLFSHTGGTLYVRSFPSITNYCGVTTQDASVYVCLNMGNPYTFGNAVFNATVNFTLSGYSSYTGSGSPIVSWTTNVMVNDTVPLNVFRQDFIQYYNSVNAWILTINSVTFKGGLAEKNSLQASLYFTEHDGINVSQVVVANTNVTVKSPIKFTWTSNCKSAPEYELQVLRLFNTDSTNAWTNEMHVKATIDWTQALDIVTGNADTSYALSLAEGRGYYLWRVRPIGTQYPGEFADSRNYGSWSTGSSYAQGSTVNLTASVQPYIFFYYQFDDTLNWVYNRSFTEGDQANSKTRVSEKVDYANELLQAKQEQAHMFSHHKLLVNQTLYDYSGRAAIQTLAAPVNVDTMGYSKGFITAGSGTYYNASFFDANSNYMSPSAVTGGAIYNYYSDVNSNVYVPGAEGYPYSRGIFEQNATGRIREQAGPGGTYHMKATNSHTTKSYYGSVTDAELIRMFGDEAPIDTAVYKEIGVDGNNTATVSYIDKEGKTIATCMAISLDSAGGILDPLPEQSGSHFAVHDTIYNHPGGGNILLATKSVVFAVPTNVTFKYTIRPNEISNACPGMCNRCDYKVLFNISSDTTNVSSITHIIGADTCSHKTTWDTSFTVLLAPGQYQIEKSLTSGVLDPATVIDTMSGQTYEQVEEDTLSARYKRTAGIYLDSVYYYLQHSKMTKLYNYLHVNTSVNNPDSVFADSSVAFNIGCSSIRIPVKVCATNSCTAGNIDFEGYFKKQWADSSQFWTPTGTGYLPYLNTYPDNFQHGQFNWLISHMVAAGYNCDTLWTCWQSLVAEYPTLKNSTYGKYKFDMLQAFLNCTGREYKGTMHSTSDTAKYIGYAFEYFLYNNNNTTCNSILKNAYGDTSTWHQDTLHGQIANKRWQQYYYCIWNVDSTPTTRNNDTTSDIAAAQCNCISVCEGRYQGFIQSLIRMYHNDSIYVQGDIYYLKKDTFNDGNVYVPDLDSLPHGFSNYKSMASIECAARDLVTYCESLCTMNVYRSGGVIDSVGTPAQRTAMAEAMTYAYSLSLVPCGGGSAKVSPAPSTTKLFDVDFGSSDTDQIWDMAIDTVCEGSYLLGGWRHGNGGDATGTIPDTTSYWAVKMNQAGVKAWDHTYGGNRRDYLRSVVQMPDGGYMLGGYSNSGAANQKSHASYGLYDYWIVKIDDQGNKIWDQTYGGSGNDILQSIHRTRDNKYLLVGYSNSPVSGNKSSASTGVNYWVVKIDSSGKKLWDKSYNNDYPFPTTADSLFGEAAVEMANGHYLIGGYSNMQEHGGPPNQGFGKYDYYLVETDTSGTPGLGFAYGGIGNDYMYDLVAFPSDTSFLLVGTSDSASHNTFGTRVNRRTSGYHGITDVWALQVNQATLSRVWDSAYGGTHTSYQSNGTRPGRYVRVRQTIDSDFVIGAMSNSGIGGDKSQGNCSGSYDEWILKLNRAGTKQWDWTYGGNQNDYFTTINQDNDGYYMIGGYSFSSNTCSKSSTNYGQSDYWILKGQESCTHDTICLTWQNPIVINNKDTIPFVKISCDSESAGQVYNAVLAQVNNKIDSAVANYSVNYVTSCQGIKSAQDTFTMSYSLGYFHYTLFYYDRAGNVVRTVSPKGVDLSSTSRLVHPNDSLITYGWYNSSHALIKQQTPDGGITYYYYDYFNRLRFTQNSRQRGNTAYSYIKFDGLSRTLETGRSTDSTNFIASKTNEQSFPLTNNSQRTYLTYTNAGPETGIHADAQTFLQNRLSFTSTDDSVYTYYSYDPEGYVKWVVQNLPGDEWKEYMNYTYDHLDGKLLEIKYDSGAIEGYYHRYYYDVDNRPMITQTTREMEPSGEDGHNQNVGWDADGNYKYYDHTPLNRCAYGQDSVQGMDYVYTLEGWIKGINYPTLSPSADPGGDGGAGRITPTDLFGMVLGYDNDDFNRTSSEFLSTNSNLISSNGATSFLYNGNVSTWTENIKSVGGNKYEQLNGYQFRFDQLNRIKKGAFRYNGGSWTMPADSDYLTKYTYDRNGNFATLSRNAYDNPSPYSAMDFLTYHTNKGTNELNYVTDTVRANKWPSDIDNESLNNYLYDSIGEMTSDVSGGISSIVWTIYGKIYSIKKSNGDSLHFVYDATQNRVEQIYIPNGGSSVITFYVYDRSGNIMSTYNRTEDANNYYYYQLEVPIYGNYRLGEYMTNTWIKTVKKNNYHIGPFYYPGHVSDNTINIVTNTQTINKHVQINGVWVIKSVIVQHNPTSSYSINVPNSNGHFYRKINQKDYELTDQLGDVKVTVSDRKDSVNNAIILSYNNEYGYGMIQPGREYNAGSYRFAHNGMEHDDNIYGTDDSYNTLNREYDPRLGKWWSTDPIEHSYQSSYLGMDDDPYLYSDPFGDESILKRIENFFKFKFNKPKYHISGAKLEKTSGKLYYVLRNKNTVHPNKFNVVGNIIGRLILIGTGLVSDDFKFNRVNSNMKDAPKSKRNTSLENTSQNNMITHELDVVDPSPFPSDDNKNHHGVYIPTIVDAAKKYSQEEDYIVPDANMNINQVQIQPITSLPIGHIFTVFKNGQQIPGTGPGAGFSAISINVKAGDVIRIVLSRPPMNQIPPNPVTGKPTASGIRYYLKIQTK